MYYQLGDRFSEDPFVLFQLRGRTKAQILDDLRRLRSTGDVEPESHQETITAPTQVAHKKETPLNIEQFWQYYEPLDSSLVVIVPPPDNRTVLDVLGNIPLSSVDGSLSHYFKGVYQTISQKAVMSALKADE